MSTAILEKPTTPPSALAQTTPVASPPRSPAKGRLILVGLDLGTNKSCVLSGLPGSTDIITSKVVPTVIGHVKDGIVSGIIAGDARALYGDDALRQMLHVHLVTPLAAGIIARTDGSAGIPPAYPQLGGCLRPVRDPRRDRRARQCR